MEDIGLCFGSVAFIFMIAGLFFIAGRGGTDYAAQDIKAAIKKNAVKPDGISYTEQQERNYDFRTGKPQTPKDE